MGHRQQNETSPPHGGTTRRGFLVRLGGVGALGLAARAVGVGLGASPQPAEAAPAATGAVPALPPGLGRRILSLARGLTCGSFSPHVDTAFQAMDPDTGKAVRLVLTRVEDRTLQRAGANPVVECFSAVFSGPPQEPLAQGTYMFSHPSMGRFDLFIVPIAQEDGAIVYEAAFSRFMDQGQAGAP